MMHNATSMARIMPPAHWFEDNVAFTGIGRSQTIPGVTRAWTVVAAEACHSAIADAGLLKGDIDGLCVDGGSTGLPGLSSEGVRGIAHTLGLHPLWHTGAREQPGQAGAVVAAMLPVATGLCRHVLCLTATGDGSSGSRTGPHPAEYSAADVGADPAINARGVALAAAEYLETFGYSRDVLGWVAVASRRHAVANLEALCRSPLEMDDYLAAETVCAPMGFLDFALPGDGAIAFVISSADAAKARAPGAIWVDAVGTKLAAAGGIEGGLGSYRLHAETSAEQLWSRASIGRSDIDFLAIDDSSTFNVLCWIEALGLCKPGDAANLVSGGVGIGPGGDIPVNPHGGELASGARGGYGNLYEAICQLRGKAADRQIQGARAAVFSSSDIAGSAAAMILVADRSDRTLRRGESTSNDHHLSANSTDLS